MKQEGPLSLQYPKELDISIDKILERVDALQSVLLVTWDSRTPKTEYATLTDGKQNNATKISAIISEQIRAEIPEDELKKGIEKIASGKVGKTPLDKIVDKTLLDFHYTEEK